MVLLAIFDARYNFTAIDVEQYGSNNASGVFYLVFWCQDGGSFRSQ